MNLEANSDITYRERRYQLVSSLRKKGIRDEKVLKVFNKVPREFFVDAGFKNRAYEDTALPINCMQTISQPYTVAYMTGLLDIHAGDKVLEIGTGSGYQAVILFLLGADVFTIERHSELVKIARLKFEKLEIGINSFVGDGSQGLEEFCPFDKIIVTAASPKIPDSLINQLGIGGLMVIPIGQKHWQTMHLIIRKTKNYFDDIQKDTFRFVPLIGEEGWKEK